MSYWPFFLSRNTREVCFRSIFSVSNVSKVNSRRCGVTIQKQLKRKTSSTVVLSEEAVETETEMAFKHRRRLSCHFSVLCSKAFIFRNIVCLFLSEGSNSQLVRVSLCLNGLRIKLCNALLLQSIHLPLQ